MLCGPDEPSGTWTQIWVQACTPDFSLNWTTRSSAIQGGQRYQCCSQPPTSKKESQSLIGRLVQIRQFLEIRLFEKIRYDTFFNLIGPKHELNKTNKTFAWTDKSRYGVLENKIPTLLTTIHLFSRLFPTLNSYHRFQECGMWSHLNAGGRQWQSPCTLSTPPNKTCPPQNRGRMRQNG